MKLIKPLQGFLFEKVKSERYPSVQNKKAILIGFSKKKGISFFQNYLSNKYGTAYIINRQFSFLPISIACLFASRNNITFFCWSDKASKKTPRLVKNLVSKFKSCRIYSCEDGIFKNFQIEFSTSFSFMVTEDFPFFDPRSVTKIKTDNLNRNEYQQFHNAFELLSIDGLKYGSSNENKIDVEVDSNCLILIGQIDGDASLSYANNGDLKTNDKFIQWVISQDKYKDKKLVFRPHPLSKDLQYLKDLCAFYNIEFDLRKLNEYDDPTFLARTSMAAIDLLSFGYRVEFTDNKSWAPNLIKKIQQEGYQDINFGIALKYLLFKNHCYFPRQFDNENKSLIIPFYLLSTLTGLKLPEPAQVLKRLEVHYEWDDRQENLKEFSILGHQYNRVINYSPWMQFVLSIMMMKLGVRDFSKFLADASLALFETEPSAVNTFIIAKQINSVKLNMLQLDNIQKIVHRLWQNIDKTEITSLKNENYFDAVQLLFSFGDYESLPILEKKLISWVTDAETTNVILEKFNLNRSFLKTFFKIHSLFYSKILTKDTPSIRIKYQDEIDAIFIRLRDHLTSNSGKRKEVVRNRMIDFILNEKITAMPNIKYIIPGIIDTVLLYFVLTKAASRNSERNINYALEIIACFMGSSMVDKEAIKEDLQASHKSSFVFTEKRWMKFSTLNLILNRKLNSNIPLYKLKNNFKSQYSSFIDEYQLLDSTPDNLTVCFFGGCLNSHTMFTEVLPFLVQNNSAVFDPFEVSGKRFLNCDLKKYTNTFNDISFSLQRNGVLLNWEIDWSSQIVKLDGVNHYQGFYERLSTYFRRYEITLENNEEKYLFEQELNRADKFIRIFRSILDRSKSNSIDISIFTNNSHVVPYSCIRDECVARGVELFLIGPAYSRLKSEKFSNSTTNFKISKYTNRYSKRAPFLVSEDDVQDWLADTKISHEQSINETRDIINNRLFHQKKEGGVRFSNYAEWRKRHPEGRVFMCLGKVSVDLAYPNDGGKLFSNYKSFIKGIENFAIKNPDVFIFFRPHPHEESPEIALSLVEKMEDWLLLEGENYVFAPPSKYAIDDILSFINGVLLYNGSAILEYSSAKIPVIAFCNQAAIDYPIGLKELSSLEELKTIDLEVPDDVQQKALLFLSCTFYDNRVIEIQNGHIAAHNMSINVPKIGGEASAGDQRHRNKKIIRSQLEA